MLKSIHLIFTIIAISTNSFAGEFPVSTITNNFSKKSETEFNVETVIEFNGKIATQISKMFIKSDQATFEKMLEKFLPVPQPLHSVVQYITPKDEIKNVSTKVKLKINYVSKVEVNKVFIVLPATPMILLERAKFTEAEINGVLPLRITQQTKFTGQFLTNEVASDCFVLGPAFNLIRNAKNNPTGLFITETADMMTVSKELKKEQIHINQFEVVECVKGSMLSLKDLNPTDPSQKTFESQIDLSKAFDYDDNKYTAPNLTLKELRDINYRLEKTPNDYKLLRNKSGLLSTMGSGEYLKAAIRNYERIIKIFPNDPGVHAQIGRMYFHLDDLINAKTWLTKASALDSKNLETINLRGQILRAEEKYLEAVEAWKEGVLLEENAFDTKLGILQSISHTICHKLNDCKQSLPYYEMLIKLNPNSHIPYKSMAIAYNNMNDFEMAIQFQRQSLKILKTEKGEMDLKDYLKLAAWTIMKQPKREPAQVQKTEAYLQEAFEYDKSDPHTLEKFIIHHLMRAEAELSREQLSITRSYLNQLKSIGPKYQDPVKLEQDYVLVEKKIISHESNK